MDQSLKLILRQTSYKWVMIQNALILLNDQCEIINSLSFQNIRGCFPTPLMDFVSERLSAPLTIQQDVRQLNQ